MKRRAAGAAVLALALLCSPVLAKLGGLRVAGTPVAAPGPGVPAVGDCLTVLDGPLAESPVMAAPPSVTSIDSVGETSVRFSDCRGPHVGEVVAYRTMPVRSADAAGPNTRRAGAGADTSDGAWCRQVASDYRAHALWRVRDAAVGLWKPSTGQRFAAILSAPTADGSASRWAACTVISPYLERYAGSYVGSLAAGAAPLPFGLCRAGDVPDRWLSCALPHGSQEFGTAVGQQMSAREGVAACRSLIGRMTGMTDITAGGLLRIEVVGAGADSGTTSGVASCRLSIVGDSRLVGTLIGIDDGPLPLA